jgi:hypothetical protein
MNKFSHKLRAEEYYVNFSTTSNPIIRRDWGKRGRHMFPKPVNIMVWVDDIDLHLRKIPSKKSFMVKSGYKISKKINDFKNSLYREENKITEYKLINITAFSTEIKNFLFRIVNWYDILLHRDVEYLNWRYCDRRSGGYIVKQAKNSSDKVVGYYVIKINKLNPEYHVGYIVELESEENNATVTVTMIKDILKTFKESNVNIVSTQVVEGHTQEKIYRKLGFVNTRRKLNLMYDVYKDKQKILGTMKNHRKFYFCFGDVDSLPFRVKY